MSSLFDSIDCRPMVADLGPEGQILVWALRTLRSHFDGVVRIQARFQQTLPPRASGIAAVSVARLSDLLVESEQPDLKSDGEDTEFLTPKECRLVDLCAATVRQDYAEMSLGADRLVDQEQAAQAIDAVASYLAAMQLRDGYGQPTAARPVTLAIH